ncbi:kinesin light chain-related protein [Chlorobaculum tepidum TLS]|uniref:Kinesin light chain-related protein n=1 Tax=Chlorobaculum tepidum (strain ATCC 49652 / DSM 12025 / NBRC 103806 / TLS) TaxID=194439 RepID=Q8KCG0_CHLTE|nr:kinesin light chain-related protein [Chlorobaculum tepidum TLS]
MDYLQGRNYELQINYPEAERYYKKAAAIEDENPLYLNARARILWEPGRYPDAEPLIRHAFAIGEKALGPKHPNTVQCTKNLNALLEKKKQCGFIRCAAWRTAAPTRRSDPSSLAGNPGCRGQFRRRRRRDRRETG